MPDPVSILTRSHPCLQPILGQVQAAFELLNTSFSNGKKLLLCGNGGSAADCEHWAGELLKGFERERPLPASMRGGLDEPWVDKLQWALPAIPLPSITGYGSAWCNDVDASLVYAQLVIALGEPGDVLAVLSTSGNSKNALLAAQTARARGLKVLALTGQSGGALAPLADVAICVSETNTAQIQELHLPVYHCICRLLENAFAQKWET